MAEKVLGIINFEGEVTNIDGLGNHRPVPAISFLGRYRVIDFVLSNMTNSGIDNIQVYCKEKPRNLIEHLGNGTQYNINSKRGKLRILYGEREFASAVYNTDVANFNLSMQYIEAASADYVVIAPSYFVYSLDYSQVIAAHKASGADVTICYTDVENAKNKYINCDILTIDKEEHILKIDRNRGKKTKASVSMECYVMTKDLFISLCKEAASISSLYWFRSILRDKPEVLDIRGYEVKGYVACISSLNEYYEVSMALRDRSAASGLFKPGWPVYTHTNDSSPSKYTETSHVTGSVVANGCVIEGTVENSIISRGVVIKKGAVVKDSIILNDSFIGEDAKLEHVIVDKYAIVQHRKELVGSPDETPIYVNRRDRI